MTPTQRRFSLVVAALLTLPVPAFATLINGGTGLGPGATTIDFGTADYPSGTVITTQYAPQGLADAGALYYGNTTYVNAFPPSTGAYLTNFADGTNIVVPDFTLQFTLQMGAADFILAAVDPDGGAAAASRFVAQFLRTVTLTAFLGNTLVERHTLEADFSASPRFVGFSGILFDRILVQTGGARVLVDSVQLAAQAVPEPSVGALGAIGLAALVGLRRRAKRRGLAGR